MLSPKMKVPNVMIKHANKISSILRQVPCAALAGRSINLSKIRPGKRKIKDAASPPVRLIMYEITGTKSARSSEIKNQIMLSARSLMPSRSWSRLRRSCSDWWRRTVLSVEDWGLALPGEPPEPARPDMWSLYSRHIFITILSSALLQEEKK